jgi:hypothetical protein
LYREEHVGSNGDVSHCTIDPSPDNARLIPSEPYSSLSAHGLGEMLSFLSITAATYFPRSSSWEQALALMAKSVRFSKKKKSANHPDTENSTRTFEEW